MTGSERVRFLVIISAEQSQIPIASDQIARQLSKQFGGATILGGTDLSLLTGYWAEDGHAFKDSYSGMVHKESVFGVMLMVVPEDEEKAFSGIQDAVKQAVSDFDLLCRHIHVEMSSVRSRHFDVREVGN